MLEKEDGPGLGRIQPESRYGQVSEMWQMSHTGYTEVRTEIHPEELLCLVSTNVMRKRKGNLYDPEKQVVLKV